MQYPRAPGRLAALRDAIIGPLRNIYGVADKVLAMTMASLLLSACNRRPLWREVGEPFVAVDTLVHNFLDRTGTWPGYGPTIRTETGAIGPEDVPISSRGLAARIDARQFNPAFPGTFPRFVQSAIWRYCAENGLDICNGNRIDDNARCDNGHCQLFRRCDCVTLHV